MRQSGLSRRRLLQTSVALGLTGVLPWSGSAAAAETPDLEKFVQPLPIPNVREPDGKRDGADYYEIPIREFERQVHPDLPPTTFWGFDGTVPGPIIRARRNERIKVRFDNTDLPSEHLFEIDERVGGTTPDDYDDYDARSRKFGPSFTSTDSTSSGRATGKRRPGSRPTGPPVRGSKNTFTTFRTASPG